jgi:hypothetical protein
MKIRSIGASMLEYASTRRPATLADVQDLVQALAMILAELDLDRGEEKHEENEQRNEVSG